jgi:hypothetical protein
MNDFSYVRDLNIKRYRKLLETPLDETVRQTIQKLLAEEQTKRPSQVANELDHWLDGSAPADVPHYACGAHRTPCHFVDDRNSEPMTATDHSRLGTRPAAAPAMSPMLPKAEVEIRYWHLPRWAFVS